MRIKNFHSGEQSRENVENLFFYEYSNHLGNVLEVITDRKLPIDDGVYDTLTSTYSSTTADGIVDYYIADVVSQSDYFPFGMLMPNTDFYVDPVTGLDVAIISDNDYRYAFNGMEKDDEVNDVKGTSYTAEFWQYDSRLGRRWNIDPVENANFSSYLTFSNNPILRMDPFGDDDYFDNEGNYIYSAGETDYIRVVNLNSKQVAEKMDGLPPDGFNEVFHGYSERIQDIPINVSPNEKVNGKRTAANYENWVLEKISRHYMTDEQNASVEYIGIAETQYAFSMREENEVYIDATYIGSGFLKLDDDLTASDLKSTLRHETDHCQNDHIGPDLTRADELGHFEIFYRDICDPDFVNTTKGHREHIYDSMQSLIGSSSMGLVIDANRKTPEQLEQTRKDRDDMQKRLDEKKEEVENKVKQNETDGN